MNQLLMPSQALGSVRQTTLYYRSRTLRSVRLFARGFLHFVIARRHSLAVVAFVVIMLSPPLTGLVQSPVAGAAATQNQAVLVTRTEAETYYLHAVNQLRASRGLAPLVIDSRLTASANQKGTDMVAQSYWGHYAPNGTAFSDYIWQTSPKADRVGENLARCFTTRQDAFDALVASPTHYAIMTGKFTNFGVAEVKDTDSGCTYTTMHFAEYQK